MQLVYNAIWEGYIGLQLTESKYRKLNYIYHEIKYAILKLGIKKILLYTSYLYLSFCILFPDKQKGFFFACL